jgi:hypothetical protein
MKCAGMFLLFTWDELRDVVQLEQFLQGFFRECNEVTLGIFDRWNFPFQIVAKINEIFDPP